MKPFIVLLSVFFSVLFVLNFTTGIFDYALSGRVAMANMLVFTGIGHFAFTKGMTLMVPTFIGFKKEIVYLTGVIEFIAAVGLLIPATAVAIGWATILFFILLLPGNIKAAINHLDYQKGTYDGPGLAYLFFRIPLQVLFILWVYFSAIAF